MHWLQLMKSEAMYAYNFEGKRYDVGDKLGFLEVTVEYALRKLKLNKDFPRIFEKYNREISLINTLARYL